MEEALGHVEVLWKEEAAIPTQPKVSLSSLGFEFCVEHQRHLMVPVRDEKQCFFVFAEVVQVAFLLDPL